MEVYCGDPADPPVGYAHIEVVPAEPHDDALQESVSHLMDVGAVMLQRLDEARESIAQQLAILGSQAS